MEDSSLVVIGESGNAIPVGSSVLSIDGKTPKDILTTLTDSLHYNYSNEASLRRAIANEGLLSTKDSATIEYEYSGELKTACIKNITMEEYVSWNVEYRSGAIPDCQLLDKVCYMNTGLFLQSKEKEYLDMIQRSDTLFIDLRFYPNEMMISFVARYLLPNKTPFVRFVMPGWKEPGTVRIVPLQFKSSDYTYEGRIIVLVDENTFSQGEYTAMALQGNPNTITVGSETCGTDGDMSVVFLPGGIAAYFTGIGVLYPDGTITQRRGVKIDSILSQHIVDSIYYGPESLVRYIQSVINGPATP